MSGGRLGNWQQLGVYKWKGRHMERAEANRNGNSAEAGAVLGCGTRYIS